MSISRFNDANFHSLCDKLAARDADLKTIIGAHGYPAFWSRKNSFESLVHIILEQQVSLAAANAALNKLKAQVLELSPVLILLLTDEEMRACYVSRQKAAYIRNLAEALARGDIKLEEFTESPDDEIRKQLISLKGIGNWTVDVYLISALHRADIFPIGDQAAVNALKRIKNLPPETTRDQLLPIIELWFPYRTMAAKLLWHYYLSSPKPLASKRT